MKQIIAFIFFIFVLQDVYSQDFCGTDHIHNILMETDSVYRANHYKMEREMIQILERSDFHLRSTEKIIIPIVVHVIHLGEQVGTGTNISDEQIIGAIQGLNDRWQNNIGNGVDMNFEFCLAVRDPNNQITSGINRVNGSHLSKYASNGIGSCGASDSNVKDLSKWPVNYCYNIWVVNKICGGWAGYANYPGTSPYNGTVIDHRTMTYQSTTLAHELGHGFNLMHTFQSPNSNCPPNNDCTKDGDKVCDTPPHRENDCGSTNPCTSSGIWDNSRKNYMSYCWSDRFTGGQKERANAAAQLSSRIKLLSSVACLPPAANDVSLMSFSVPLATIYIDNCIGNDTITPVIKVINFGTNAISNIKFGIVTKFDTISSFIWEGELHVSQEISIELPHIRVDTGINIINVTVDSVNFHSDPYLFNNSLNLNFHCERINSIQINSKVGNTSCYGSSDGSIDLRLSKRIEILEDFESEQTWTIDNGDYSNFWIVGNKVANSGNRSIYITDDSINYKYNPSNSAYPVFYKQFYFPENCSNVKLKFDLLVKGIASSNSFGGVLIYAIPGHIEDTENIDNYRITYLYNIASFTEKVFDITARIIKGTNVTILFQWINWGSAGIQPPAAIDNIEISYDLPNPNMLIFEWTGDTLSNEQNLINLKAGTYHIKVIDEFGCSAEKTIIVEDPQGISIEEEILHNSCFGMAEGKIKIVPLDGIAPYDFLWSTGSILDSIENLIADKYFVTITDHKGYFEGFPIEPTCTPITTNYGFGYGIYNVKLNEINKNSSSGFEGYCDFTNEKATIEYGKINQLEVTISSRSDEKVIAWIDFNNDGIFQEDEIVMKSQNPKPDNIHKSVIVIPESAVLFMPLRMRIMSDDTYPEPCKNVRRGQCEDYTVFIGKPACSFYSFDVTEPPPIDAKIIYDSTKVLCLGDSIELELPPGYMYLWNNNDTLQSIFVHESGDYYAIVTDMNGCIAYSDTISILFNPLLTPEVSIQSDLNSICEGENVILTATPVHGGPSPVYHWYVNDVLQTENSGPSFPTFSLTPGSTVYCIMSSNESCLTQVSVTSNPISVEVLQINTPSLNITESQNNICDGQNVIFTATPVNGGENPTYNWMINDVSQIIGPSNTFAANTLEQGDNVSCLMTSNAICLTNPTALSNEVEMIVNPILTASVQIEATITEICSGQTVTFTASPLSGGASPGYKWYVNDILQGETSSVFNATGLQNGALVKAEMNSSEACVEPAAATSNSISITVNPLLTPEVSILASKNSICEGENIAFTATAVNGGTNPVFKWYINNDLQEGYETTFSTTTLASGSQVHCVMTSNETCLAQPSGTSNVLTIEVFNLVTPTVSVSESQNNICDGQNVMFTATPVNGGENPTYNWMLNDESQQNGASNTFAANTLEHADKITCLMTSNAMCLANSTALSNEVVMIVNPILTASVQIAAVNTEICFGQSVTFTASPVNGGASPGYKWYVNDILQSETSSVFNATGLENGAVVKAEMISSEACVEPTIATSNSISITVNPLLTPEVSILASKNLICDGENVTFTATAVNGGINPVYNWYINNDLQEGHESTFSTTTLASGSQVHCVMTSNEVCLAQTLATSNFVSVAVNPLLTPKVVINASSTAVFSCEQVTFTPTPSHGGLNPTYKWLVNGNIVSTVSTFVTSSLVNGAQVQCIMTSSANCVSTPTVSSEIITMTVFPLPQPELKLRLDTISVTNYSGSQYSYTWYFNGTMVSTQPNIICSTHGNGSYYVVVKLNNCTVTSNTVEFDCATSISATEDGNKFKLFPNPTDGIIKIEGEQLTFGTFHIELRNILGVLIANQKLNVGDMQLKTEFDLNNYPGGIYLIVISSDTFRKVYSINKFN